MFIENQYEVLVTMEIIFIFFSKFIYLACYIAVVRGSSTNIIFARTIARVTTQDLLMPVLLVMSMDFFYLSKSPIYHHQFIDTYTRNATFLFDGYMQERELSPPCKEGRHLS